ncbi:MAG TPA: 50S ribosomal protein L10 [Planctomycetota bacterium]|jgi:large subunit ribosomal protein L10|nr:50S ribosomal protein L10 [Planctomycetota bacterium]OQC19599.1 MAG: 50S ribosomal protein L10 [Planctomycetes bacterium ADurb.Bin069]NMD36630.1 50S ribosomal protein L10 [Planctomycetota bacterium]HNR99011.1 50S ribosomal protein L10 [Planctomycetota bacterium]HOE30236.1 50S ribosomal protein L10 [Planctomycetota bacterium]
MAKALRTLIVEEIKQWAPDAESCVLVDFRGLAAKDADALRRLLRAKGVQMNVVPNRLYRRALAEAASETLAADDALAAVLKGPTAVVFGGDGAVTAAALLVNWCKDHKNPVIKGGLFDRRVIGAQDVADLAKIPPVPVLLAQVAGGMASPLRGLVGVLSGLMRGLVCALQAIKDTKKE